MVKRSTKEYGNDSITMLKDEDRVRLRPSVIFGSDDVNGCCHAVFEILSNSIDEAREGFGDTIRVTRHADGSITVQDFGRGCPVDWNQTEQKYNWELVFCELYAGGKFKNNDEEHYEYSLGLNGLGLCATQYASEYMDVRVVRDGYEYNLHFERGKNVGGLDKKETKAKQTGSTMKWKPDDTVFTDINIPREFYVDTLKKQAVVNAGLTFIFFDEESGTTETFYYKEGIRDYIKELGGESAFTQPVYLTHEARGRDKEDRPEYRFRCEIAFCFSNEQSVAQYYHNSSFLEHGGSPEKAMKTAFTYAIDSYLKQQGLYKKDEKRLTTADVLDCLIFISNGFSTITSYENQTKKSINNRFIQETMTEFLKKQLEIYFIENKMEADKLAAQVLANKRSRETAEKTRLSIKKKLTAGVDIANRVEKFVNCRSRDVAVRELYIVEGDSALGACKMARDPEFQGIMPVRGKILNCLKADYDKIFASEIISDLLRVLGCGVEIRTKGHHKDDGNTFDLSKLNWSKVIICTDGDVDGFHIRTMILTMIQRLVPTLISARKVFIAETPLYEITSAKKTHFAYSDREKDEIVKKLSGKIHIQRSKGLGENEPDMMWLTTMCPETRRLISVCPEEAEKTSEMFELLLGDNLRGRKEFIEQFGHKYIDLTEVV